MGGNKEERPGVFPHPASHSQVTHYGARVAPQRCPILRVSKAIVTDLRICLQKYIDAFSMCGNGIRKSGALTCRSP